MKQPKRETRAFYWCTQCGDRPNGPPGKMMCDKCSGELRCTGIIGSVLDMPHPKPPAKASRRVR